MDGIYPDNLNDHFQQLDIAMRFERFTQVGALACMHLALDWYEPSLSFPATLGKR